MFKLFSFVQISSNTHVECLNSVNLVWHTVGILQKKKNTDNE